MKKIIFLDIDGTLVSFATHRIPQSAISALDKLKSKGIEIVIVTGRAASYIPEIEGVPYSALIGLNGSECITRDGTVITKHRIPPTLFEKSLALGEKYDFSVGVEFGEGFVVDRMTQRVKTMSERIAHPLPEIRNLRDLYAKESTGQLCFFTDTETEKEIMPQLPGLSASRWCDVFADINLSGVDKGTGIRDYAAFKGIDLADTIAFGDGGNDLPMLTTAGTGVAMGNASDAVKACADYVTDDIDNDGLAKALLHYHLI